MDAPPTLFLTRKRKILQQLAVPEAEYTDLSPKGSVDETIRPLVNAINARDEYVTTSSCAGRIAVFLEGAGAVAAKHALQNQETGVDRHGNEEEKEEDDQEDGRAFVAPASSAQGGKGSGGKWLFVSHEPVALPEMHNVYSLLGFQDDDEVVFPDPGTQPRFVHLKFEPMILHILSSSLPSAQHALNAGQRAGFRESGISSILPSNPQTPPTPLVAIRTTGLALDCIIGFLDEHGGRVKPMVAREYLVGIMGVANARFDGNAVRRERFGEGLLLGKREEEGTEWEEKEVRRERLRDEGLRRRAEMKKEGDEAGKVGAEVDGLEGLFGEG